MQAAKKNGKKIVAALLTLLVVAGGVTVLTGTTSKAVAEPEEVDKSIYVNTSAPITGDIVLSSEFVGTVEPDQYVTVYPKLAGEILATHFNVGDPVEAGDVLMELDSRDLQFTISQTQAAISAAESKLQLSLEMTAQERENFLTGLESGTNPDVIKAEAEVRAAEIEVQAASTSLLSARRTWREAKNGDSDVYVTDEQIDALKDAVTGYELALEGAQLRQEAAEEALRAVQKGIRDGQVSYDQSVEMAGLNANLSEQYIALQSLQATLGDAMVRAPISGTIEYKYVDTHDMAAPSIPSYVITNKDVMTVSFSIPEASLPYVAQGDKVMVEKNGQTVTGTITEVSTMVVGGLYPIKASVEQAPFDLNTGSTVKIYADTQKAVQSILVPIDAIHYSGGTTSVFVYRDGIARQVQVQTGISNEEYMQVVSGLTMNDQIITTWNSKLADGVEVLLPAQEQLPAPQSPAAESDPEPVEPGEDGITGHQEDQEMDDTLPTPEQAGDGEESSEAEAGEDTPAQ